jgi:ribosomal protein S12 methylthiotransferase
MSSSSILVRSSKESIGAVHEAVDGRADSPERKKQKIIVAGCMSQRFAQELPSLMPDVDAFIGLDQVTQVAPIIERLMGITKVAGTAPDNHVTKQPKWIPDYDTPRFRLTPKHMAYVKIAEGCNHTCSFCIIPKIRGRHRSRTQESIVKEVQQLVEDGVKEINLISQDTTYFGMDKWTESRPNPRSPVDSTKGESLATLIKALDEIKGDFWIRLLYTHPAHWSDELIEAIANSTKVARYIDMPLQHISDNMLTLMRRETNGNYIRDLIARIRKGIPDIAIRTTFIVGFPGETESDFNELIRFIEDEKFERAGVFEYSREEGTKAASMEDPIHHMTRKRRWNEAMRAIQRNIEGVNQKLLGKKIKVLIEEPGVGRSQHDAPDIDATVLVDKKHQVGSFVELTVKEWRGYDVIAA